MSSVRSLDDMSQELERFFDCLYGDQIGYVYSPTKDPHTDGWEQFFFEWPYQKVELVQHAIEKSASREVYHGVVLFNTDKATKESVMGTNYIWAEFDGEIPKLSELDNTPPPTIRIQSSLQGHEHWYWRLEGFVKDINVIENITQRLAYHLKADLSCWDVVQVLRPPNTTHHQSQQMTTLVTMGSQAVPITSFAQLPEIPIKILQEDDIHHVPVVLNVIAKYPWTEDDINFFREMKIDKGYRSSALTKLGHICIEMGMTNAETLSILFNANARWKKYSELNAKKRLLGIISYCRALHPVDAIKEEIVEESPLRVYTYNEFMQTEIKLEWVVPGLLHRKGLLMISGPPGVGKSQLVMRLSEKLSKSEKFLRWPVSRPIKTLFVSMEMPHEEVKYFYEQMRIDKSELMDQNTLILPVGYSMKLTSPKVQHALNKIIEEFQPDGIFFDSFGRAVGDDLDSTKIIFSVLDYVDHILRGQYSLFVGFIHHNRKAQIGNKKPNKLDDLFGSQFVGAGITTGIGLWPTGGNEIEVSCLKLRMEKEFSPFNIRRTPDLDFELNEARIVSGDMPLLGISSRTTTGDSHNSNGYSSLGDSI